MEWAYNVKRRDPIAPENREIFLISYFDVPEAEVQVVLGAYPSYVPDQLKIVSDGETYYRFFIPDKYQFERRWNVSVPLQDIRARYELKRGRYYAAKIQGNGSFLIFDSVDIYRAFVAKFFHRRHDIKKNRNKIEDGAFGVRAGDYIRNLLESDPHPLVEFLYEPSAYGIKKRTRPDPEAPLYAQSTRELSIDSIKNEKTTVYPLHALLGLKVGITEAGTDYRTHLHRALEEAASHLGVTVSEWVKNEYAKKLARFVAITQFRYGIYIEGHTQNLLARINNETGEIESFLFRDATDVLFDYYPLIAKGKKVPVEIFGQQTPSEIFRWTRTEGESDRLPEYMFLEYTNQSMKAQNLPFDTETLSGSYKNYLLEFIEQAQEITGVKILFRGKILDVYNKILRLEEKGAGITGDDLLAIKRYVFEEIQKVWRPYVRSHFFTGDQKVLRDTFRDQYTYHRVATLHRDFSIDKRFINWKRVKYAYDPDKRRILAYTGANNVLAVTLEIAPEHLFAIRQQMEKSCSWIMSFFK
jgi:hypothetical protein